MFLPDGGSALLEGESRMDLRVADQVVAFEDPIVDDYLAHW